MCSCQCSHEAAAPPSAAAAPGLMLRVADMSCGRCSAAITKAVEGGLPGTRVFADPATKLVRVEGAVHPGRVRDLIVAAGYTPSPV